MRARILNSINLCILFIYILKVLVGVFRPECEEELMRSVQFTGAQRLAGWGVIASASIPSSEFPLNISSCPQVIKLIVNDNCL